MASVVEESGECRRWLGIIGVAYLYFCNPLLVEFSVFVSLYIAIMFKLAVRRPLANSARNSSVTKRYAHAPVPFNWEDPLDHASLFTEEELAIQETANSYCQERMLPRVLGIS